MNEVIKTAAALIDEMVNEGLITYEVAYKKLVSVLNAKPQSEEETVDAADVKVRDAFADRRNGGMIINALHNNQCTTLGELSKYRERDLRRMDQIGNLSISSIRDTLTDYGLGLATEIQAK